ncbi:TolB family protein [Oculatella sp. LEGE 06141]|nr:TolB family protein [Oculatella sp. LEGE 06141]
MAIALLSLVSGCTGSRILSFPVDASGRSLNSPFADLSPQVTNRYIVFASDRNGSQDIYLFDWVERRLVELPELNAIDTVASHPAISQDGRYIVFAASQEGKANIYLHDRQLRQTRNLTTSLKAEVRHPTISADGSTIAFESNLNGQWDIVLYDRAGQPLPVPTAPR